MTELLKIENHEVFSKETASEIASKPKPIGLTTALGYAAMSVYTLLRTPPHETYHRTMEEELQDPPQPLQPNLEMTEATVRMVMNRYPIVLQEAPTPLVEKITESAYMMQFTDHFLQKSANARLFSYEDMKRLKNKVVDQARQQEYPLSYGQQLDVALELTDGDIIKALTQLCYTSRQYARWLDSTSIEGLPDMTPDQILTEMKDWRTAVLANKPNTDDFQDPAGDTYYAWTHALAAVLFGKDTALHDRIGTRLFRRGTDIMHTIVHTLNAQSVPNDHRIAAKYGNRIGEIIVEEWGRV